MTVIKRWLSVISILCLLSCAETPELLKNNNPDKYTVAKDVLWASPDEFDLTMDIYTPTSGKEAYPVLLIFHGGGWLINHKGIMTQASKYLASNSEYVICNVDYRLLVDEQNTVTIDQIVEDVFGSVLWVQEHISHYDGDVNNIAVTGDSAGGHLAAMIVNSGHLLGSDGYSEQSLRFTPSYLPTGMTAEQVDEQGGISVQAAILSYGAYDIYASGLEGVESWKNPFWLMAGSLARGLFGDKFNATDNPSLYKGVSPSYLIPQASERQLPAQLLTAGSEDKLISPASVRTYMAKLQNAGHDVQYWEHDGRGHAFLDSGSNSLMGQSFEKDAPLALDVMIKFLDGVFY
ncbi:MAG: alpha/beta hydrolase [Porticoccaceae bacterium]|nr:alpha/beta hydrolase [Porticoccaceae bacterium]MBT6421407.1 alpha/beta hydrolase [Porticoccaceae bacterium]MBT6693666.1 alpha/beta hydrolase [Porticoccaceae bacterium]